MNGKEKNNTITVRKDDDEKMPGNYEKAAEDKDPGQAEAWWEGALFPDDAHESER